MNSIKITRFLLVIHLILLLAANSALSNDFPVSLIGRMIAIDGDSFWLEVDEQDRIEIRLFGINAPEWNNKDGKASQQQLLKIVAGRAIKCIGREKDIYNRIVSMCYVNNESINLQMIKSGFARAFRKYLKNSKEEEEFIAAEKNAKSLKHGIWRN